MNHTNSEKLILLRMSRRINWSALPTAYSRVGNDKKATADASRLSPLSTPLLPSPIPITNVSLVSPRSSDDNCDAYGMVSPTVKAKQSLRNFDTITSLVKPRTTVFLAAFNVRTLKQIGQQTALARTLDSLSIDVCCISETRIQDCTIVCELTAPSLSSRYWLRTSGDPEASAAGQAGVGIVLSSKAEASLIDWIPVNSRLCAVRLMTSVRINNRSHTRRCLFVISAYAPTDSSCDAVKDAFYSELNALLQKAKSSDIVIVTGDMNAQLGRLSASEAQLGGMFSLDSKRTDNGERLLHLCADHRLFLSSTNFRRSKRRCATWRPPSNDQPWTQIDHIAISHRWRGSILDCRSFWNTYVDSDHALVRCRFSLNFAGRPNKKPPRLAIENLTQSDIKQRYQSTLSMALADLSCTSLEGQWNNIATAMHGAGISACGISRHPSNHWVSNKSLKLLESRKQIPSGSEHNSTRRNIRRQLKESLKVDREAWWTKKAEEMEEANGLGNSRRLFQLIRSTGPKGTRVSETICESNGSLISNRERRLARWAEHFEEQFSRPSAPTGSLMNTPQCATWSVNLDAPTELEIRNCISAMKRYRAAGPDDLVPALFKDGGEVLVRTLTELFRNIWDKECVPTDWGASIIVPLFKKGVRSECGNHRGISLTPVITRLLASVILRRLMTARESQIREEQAGFRPGRGCVDHIFTLRQVLEQRHVYRQPTIVVFLDFKAAFDSVDRSVLFSILLSKGMPVKFVNILRTLYAHTTGRVRVYNQLSDSFPTTSGVRQGCPLSPFLFNFVIDVIMECSLKELNNGGVDVYPGPRLVDLEYADDVVLLFDNFQIAQETLNRLSAITPSFGMRFAPSKCKVLLQDHPTLDNALILQGEHLECVKKFTYLGSCISSDGSVTEEVSSRIAKARIAFMNLRHLWRQKGISLGLKGRIYKAAVRPVLLYGSETWPIRAEDFKHLQTFDHRCLRSIAGIGWKQKICNEEVRRLVLGNNNSLEQQIRLHRLRWLGHVLRMPSHRLPNRVLFSAPKPDWRKVRGGQAMTWQREMKALTARLGKVGSVRLPGWGPRDPPCTWLETLRDMAYNRCQWRSCCHLLAEMPA